MLSCLEEFCDPCEDDRMFRRLQLAEVSQCANQRRRDGLFQGVLSLR
jgi:hypothetical protein